jgi:hypothetical protein
MKPTGLCRNLRNKSMYIPALVERDAAENVEQTGHSHHCWCNCTMSEVGPDDRAVGPKACDSSRSCFEE